MIYSIPICRHMTLQEQVTQLLVDWGNGNGDAFNQLMPLVYAELHRMAHRYMGTQSPSHTLQTTALIHEAYFRLAGQSDRQLVNRAHFFAVAAKSMRNILVDHARAHSTSRRGGPNRPVALDEAVVISGDRMHEVVALDDALTDLAKLHSRQSTVIELRYFGGLSVEETAEILGVSAETVMRDWRAAKAWLRKELTRGQATEHQNDA